MQAVGGRHCHLSDARCRPPSHSRKPKKASRQSVYRSFRYLTPPTSPDISLSGSSPIPCLIYKKRHYVTWFTCHFLSRLFSRISSPSDLILFNFSLSKKTNTVTTEEARTVFNKSVMMNSLRSPFKNLIKFDINFLSKVFSRNFFRKIF